MKCPACGAVNPDYAFFCGKCAASLPRVPAQPTGARICPKCRSSNPEGQKFCGNCGLNLDEGMPEGPAYPDSDSPEPGWLEPGSTSFWVMKLDWKLRWAMVGFVGIFMGIIFAVVAAQSGDPEMWGFSLFFLVAGALGAFATWLNLGR